MPLLAFWKSAPDEVRTLTIEQVVANAGDGLLRDQSSCSAELRDYFLQISSEHIATYIDQCLASGFSKGGMVLQDLVNELGRRLGYTVENGRYQGTTKAVGFDGLWSSPGSGSIVIEVKTTDTYRISLDTIASYRSKLSDSGKIPGASSILIVVGRNDTGDLEAQVRGSRHAWDIRLISTDALVKLVQLRENTEAGETEFKIRNLLTPMEYTRLDNIIDIMFTAATDLEATTATSTGPPEDTAKSEGDTENTKRPWQFTEKHLLYQKREQIISALSAKLGTALIRKRGAYFWDATHDKRLICTISKRYSGPQPYWYGYHTEWHEFLLEADGRLALGCMDLKVAFCVPVSAMTPILNQLNTTMDGDVVDYWHLRIFEPTPGRYALALANSQSLSLEPYRVPLD